MRLFSNMYTYKKFTKLVHEISWPSNLVIGTLYLLTPINCSMALILLFIKPITNIDKILNILMFLWLPYQLILIYALNYFCASIPLRNRSIAKYSYPVFYDKNFYRIQIHRLIRFYSYRNRLSNIFIHMKIDSFIARLNKQYVAFYCYNLFKLTKLAILQFFCYCITVYILIFKLNI